MKILFLLVGKTEQPYLKEGINLYAERLKRYTTFQLIEIPELKMASNLSQSQIKDKEAESILKYVKDGDELILLDERGKQYTSEAFAGYVEKKGVYGTKSIVFVVGGAYGFNDNVYDRANDKISLSLMTFSHQMVRLFFLEQLYRAFTIIKGEPYHHK